MQPSKQAYTISLPHCNLEATIVLERIGQCVPADSDRVRVQSTLLFPTLNHQLPRALQFGDRVILYGRAMVPLWGVFDEESDRRGSDKLHVAATWQHAFFDAKGYAEGELQKLVDALNARHEALEKAEEETF